jgi:XTP/dITP diphosphohydrolase
MNLIFATHNQHKTDEIRNMVGNLYTILNLKDLDCFEEIPETSNTLNGNALQKAEWVAQRFGINCFADDTGLEIEALDNRPGVFSARYAGEHCSFKDNMEKVLKEMQDFKNRKACFKTVIALIFNKEIHFFEGKIDGIITQEAKGNTGFGYDPIFQPAGYQQTFAELGNEIKNKISHRALAFNQMLDFLKNR